MLWRRYLQEEKTSGETKGGQEEDEDRWQCGDPSKGLFGGVKV